MHPYEPAPDLHTAVFVGQAAPVDGRESALRIVFSNLATDAVRRRTDELEFPLSLDMLESYLRGQGYTHGDYAFLPEAEVQETVHTGPSRPVRPLSTLGVRGQAPFAVREARLWAIQMQSYLQAPAFFSLLQLAGVPALSRERSGGHTPLLVLGGPVWPNPLPLADFYDVLLVGEGEEVLARIAALCEVHSERSEDRAGLLAAIAKLEGTYVPGLSAEPVRQARINFQEDCFPAGSSYLIDGVGAVVLARGCPHACAFCNHNQVSGAYRVKPAEQVKAQIDLLARAGARTILPIASTASAYQSGEQTIFDILAYINERGAAVRTNPDRPERINAQYLRLTVPQTGRMILAPEAGPRIREKVFRKTIAEQTLYDLISECIAVGINRIQLCAILSLPPISPGVVDFLPSGFEGEQPDDLSYLAELARSIADQMAEAGLKPQPGLPFVQIECMPFIPAIGTHLEKAAFPSYAHYQARIRALQGMLGPYYHDLVEVHAAMDQSSHLLQAFLERGDSRAGLALWQVWRTREALCLTPKEVLQAIRLSGQDWKGISAEFRGRRLPYEGLICWEDCGGE